MRILMLLMLLSGCTTIRNGCTMTIEIKRLYSCADDGQLKHFDYPFNIHI